MFIGNGQEAPEVFMDSWVNWAPVVFTVIVVLLIGASFFVVKKWVKR
jgi:hypothetical protein